MNPEIKTQIPSKFPSKKSKSFQSIDLKTSIMIMIIMMMMFVSSNFFGNNIQGSRQISKKNDYSFQVTSSILKKSFESNCCCFVFLLNDVVDVVLYNKKKKQTFVLHNKKISTKFFCEKSTNMNTFLQPSARKISIFFQCVPNRGVIQVVFF